MGSNREPIRNQRSYRNRSAEIDTRPEIESTQDPLMNILANLERLHARIDTLEGKTGFRRLRLSNKEANRS